jgi:hypothetical protein
MSVCANIGGPMETSRYEVSANGLTSSGINGNDKPEDKNS